jgi:asparagine synthase (glutamine-hydrolysing)
MCGVGGEFSYGEHGPVCREKMSAMAERMRRRGPDGGGMWIGAEGRVALIHRRLAILDLSPAGAQPMSSADGTLHITYNGEIYNFPTLRRSLESLGHSFRSRSDTEVLLAAYRQHGAKMVEHLEGMFAFAIWDDERKGLFLARDHFGIKPLYIYDDGDRFVFASQVKALLAGLPVSPGVEPAGHVGFFLWGSVPEPFTLFKNVYALPAGHSLWVDENGARIPTKYFDVADALRDDREVSAGDAAEALISGLRGSVQRHLLSDVPVGIFLSAGLDSTAIAAIATEQGKQLHAVTLGFDEFSGEAEDEVPISQTVASRFNLVHHLERINRKQFEQELSDILDSMDQPSIDGVNTYFVAKAAEHIGLKVALSGLGGDEILGGYPSYTQVPRIVKAVAAPSRIPMLGKMWRHLALRALPRATSPKYAGLVEYGGTTGGAYLLRRALFMPWELPRLVGRELAESGLASLRPLDRLDEIVQRIPTRHAAVTALEMSIYLRNTLLRDADWAGMAHSVEIRVPFIDVALFRAVAPFIRATAGWPKKQQLSDFLLGKLPKEILDRQKTGFAVPVQRWVSSGHEGERENRGLRPWAKRVIDLPRGGGPKGESVLALVSDAFGGRGGIAKFNRDLLWALSNSRRVERVAVLPRSIQDEVGGLPPKLFVQRTFKDGKLAYVLTILRELFKRPAPDLVLCGHINLLPLAWVAARMSRSQLWIVVHGIDAWRPNKNRLVNALIRDVDKVLSVSELTRERFLQWSGLPASAVQIVSNSFDPSIFSPGPRDQKLIEKYGLKGRRVVMTVGRLVSKERYKGFDEVISALSSIASQVPNVIYVIAGDGDDRPRLEARVAELGLQNHVVFTGYVPEDEKPRLYRLADAYVMPSRGEGFGIVLLEAMASGVPAIGSVLDGSREALANGALGTIVDPRNEPEIVAAVVAALKGGSGVPPVGLEKFSLGSFRVAVANLVSQSGAAA